MDQPIATSFPVTLLSLSGEVVEIAGLPEEGATLIDLRVRLQELHPSPSDHPYVLLRGEAPILSDQDGMLLSVLKEDGATISASVIQAALKPGDPVVYDGEARRVAGKELTKGMLGYVVEVSSVDDELRVRIDGIGSIIVARRELKFLDDAAAAEAKVAALRAAEARLVELRVRNAGQGIGGMSTGGAGSTSVNMILAAEAKVAELRAEVAKAAADKA